jgi:REP element-mobilizing transposase RayT
MNPNPITKSHRHLPHWQKEGAIYWITFRLADAIPQSKLNAWRHDRHIWLHWNPKPWDPITEAEYQERFGKKVDQWLDAGYGSCALKHNGCRHEVRTCILRFHEVRHRLHHGVIMPNHVHLLLELYEDQNLSKLLQGMKSASSRACNQIRNTAGTFWMDESYDRIVRDQKEYTHFLRYIDNNPKKAKLREREYDFLP